MPSLLFSRVAVGALALAALAPAAAQSPGSEPEFSPAPIRADIRFLADDLLAGRESGAPGFDIAARFVASRFEALGLRQAVPDSWFQPVPLSTADLVEGAKADLLIGKRRFANKGDVLIGPSISEATQRLSAPAMFVGYGLEDKDSGIDDYAGLDVAGKVVVALSGAPVGMPSEIGAYLASEKSAVAQRHGAVGLITLPTDAALARRPWARMVAMGSGRAMSRMDEKDVPYARAPGIRLTATVNGKAADALFAGSASGVAAIRAEAAREGARPRGFALPAPVEIRRTSRIGRRASENVVAILPGRDPALANDYVLLMAHLDHLGVKPGTEPGDHIYNGAMDNASGVATLMAVARAFAEGGKAPRRSILFAAVTGEEKGLLGSQYLARHPVLPPGGRLVGVVNLDMPILTYDFQDVIAFGADHSTLGPIVARAARQAGIALSPDPLPAEGLFTRSDHYRFVQEGVPSVFLMTGFAGPGKEAFEHFLSTNYHQPSDQIDLPFHWGAAAKFARVNYLIAREIADGAEAPRWYEGDSFGDAFAPGGLRAKRGGNELDSN